jgi:hypothetical protein
VKSLLKSIKSMSTARGNRDSIGQRHVFRRGPTRRRHHLLGAQANQGWRCVSNGRGTVLYQAKSRRAASISSANLYRLFFPHPSYRKPTGFTETPIYEHEDGRTYTLTNESDAASRKNSRAHGESLRKGGFSGPIESGGDSHTKGKPDQRYVATYFFIKKGENKPFVRP